MFGGKGLSEVPTEALERLLKRLFDGSLEPPITHPALLRAGLPDLVDRVGHLGNLDRQAAIAVVVAVLAERRKALRAAGAQGPRGGS